MEHQLSIECYLLLLVPVRTISISSIKLVLPAIIHAIPALIILLLDAFRVFQHPRELFLQALANAYVISVLLTWEYCYAKPARMLALAVITISLPAPAAIAILEDIKQAQIAYAIRIMSISPSMVYALPATIHASLALEGLRQPAHLVQWIGH